MANIIRRQAGGGRPLSPTSMWEPFRLMRDMLGWEPFLEAAPLGERAYLPTFDVKETKDAYVLKADLPGVKDEHLDVSVAGNQLTVSGNREEERKEEGETYYTSEITYGSFNRTFSLPDGCDTEHVSAELKNGVLTLTVPKKAEVQSRKIAIGKGEAKAKA